jgi:hypothetical protein
MTRHLDAIGRTGAFLVIVVAVGELDNIGISSWIGALSSGNHDIQPRQRKTPLWTRVGCIAFDVRCTDFSPCYTWFCSALTLRQAEPRLRRCALPANRSPERSITIPTLTMWQAKLRYDKRLGCGEEPRVEHAMMRRCGGHSCFGLVSAECTTTRRRLACTSKFLVGPRASTREPTTSVPDRSSTATLVLCLFVACVLEATAFAESWQPLASHCDESCRHCPRHRRKGQNCFNRIWGWQTVSDTGAVVSCEE